MKFNIKILYLVVIVSYSTLLNAQHPADFNALKASGLKKFDSEKVIKKLKITEDSLQIKVKKHISTYNNEIDNLLLLHSNQLEDLQEEFDRNIKIAIQTRDRNKMNGVKSKIEKIIPLIRLEVQKHKEVLNEALFKLLSEKGKKKWLSYSTS